MSDEIKVTEEKNEKECKCFCRSEGFRNFLIVAVGSFVGVFCALSLFAALHRPPMMPPCPFNPHRVMKGCPVQVIQHHHFKGDRADNFHKKAPKEYKQRAPFEAQRAEDND